MMWLLGAFDFDVIITRCAVHTIDDKVVGDTRHGQEVHLVGSGQQTTIGSALVVLVLEDNDLVSREGLRQADGHVLHLAGLEGVHEFGTVQHVAASVILHFVFGLCAAGFPVHAQPTIGVSIGRAEFHACAAVDTTRISAVDQAIVVVVDKISTVFPECADRIVGAVAVVTVLFPIHVIVHAVIAVELNRRVTRDRDIEFPVGTELAIDHHEVLFSRLCAKGQTLFSMAHARRWYAAQASIFQHEHIGVRFFTGQIDGHPCRRGGYKRPGIFFPRIVTSSAGPDRDVG